MERTFDDEIDAEFGVGETPLHYADAYNHNPESIRFLISQGLDLEADARAGASGSFGGRPLFFAIEHQNLKYSNSSEEAKQVRGEIASYGLRNLSQASRGILVGSRTALS